MTRSGAVVVTVTTKADQTILPRAIATGRGAVLLREGRQTSMNCGASSTPG